MKLEEGDVERERKREREVRCFGGGACFRQVVSKEWSSLPE